MSALNQLLSPVAKSNLYTMGIASQQDKRQAIPTERTMPNAEIRALRARLIMEEALETCAALGVMVTGFGGALIENKVLDFDATDDPNCESLLQPSMEQIIDGCCDTIYVCVGTLCSMGVPDSPHLEHVCRCNDAKFPNGKGTFNESGKFLKPANWQPPNHSLAASMLPPFNLQKKAFELIALRQKD